MNFSRNSRLGAMVVCVAALAGIYLNSRGQFGFDHSDEGGKATAATPTPSTPASSSATTTTANTIRQPLPKSKPEIIAALAVRCYILAPFIPGPPIADVSGYRVADIPAAVAFTEHNGTLTMVDVATVPVGKGSVGPLLLDFAEIVGEVATGRSRDTTRQAIAQTMNAIGKTPGRLSCSFGAGKDRFRHQVTRHDGGYSFAFTLE